MLAHLKSRMQIEFSLPHDLVMVDITSLAPQHFENGLIQLPTPQSPQHPASPNAKSEDENRLDNDWKFLEDQDSGPPSLAVLAGQNGSFTIKSLLTSLNIFILWKTGILMTGISVLSGFGRLKSLSVILLILALSVLFTECGISLFRIDCTCCFDSHVVSI